MRRCPPAFGVGLSPLLVPFLLVPQLRLRFPQEDQGPPATASTGWEPAPPASRPANLEEIPATRRALHLITKSGRSRRTPAQPENSPHPLLPQRFFRHQEAATSEINVIAPCCERLLQPQGLMKGGGCREFCCDSPWACTLLPRHGGQQPRLGGQQPRLDQATSSWRHLLGRLLTAPWR